MASFTGHAEHSIDSKGRVPVPMRMRRAMTPEADNTFMATRGIERCLYLYPLDHWQREIETRIEGLNQFDPESRHFARLMFMWAEPVTLDGQGRVAFSKKLAEWAGLQPGGKAFVNGAFSRVEVWAPETFEAYLNEQEAQYEELAKQALGGKPLLS